MEYIVDILFAAVIVWIIVASARKGFTATLLDTFSVLISGFATYKFTKPVANFFYDLCVRDLVMTNFRHTLDKMAGNLSLQQKITNLIDSLPKTAVKFAEGIGVNVNQLKASILQSAADTDDKLIEAVTDTVAHDIMMVITQVVSAVVLFILLSIVVSLVAKLFVDIVKKIPLIGSADTIMGGVFGAVKALIIVGVVTTVLFVFVTSADTDSPLKIVEQSKIYNFINEYNPIVELINK